MNQENIFTKLKFTPVREKDLIVSQQNINKISKLFDDIFVEAGENQQVFITQTIEAEALAISTAEDSSLSTSDVTNIELTDEQSLRITKYQKSNFSTEKKYELLEYENVKDISGKITGIDFRDFNIEIICQLHHDLTVGLDEYASVLKVSKYHPGKLRGNNAVKVGKFPPYEPPNYEEIEPLLTSLFHYYQNKDLINLVDILEFGILLYAIHPFQNGNKRIVRIMESSLLYFYGYSAKRTISLGRAYAIEKTGFNHFLLSALKERNATAFINYSLRCYIDEGKRNIINSSISVAQNKLEKQILLFSGVKKHKQYMKAFSFFKEHLVLTNSQFSRLMEKNGYGHSVAQGILKEMQEEDILIKTGKGKVLYAFSGYRQFENLVTFIEKYIKK